MRLIDADALKRNFDKLCDRFGEDFHISAIETEIDAAKNADAVPLRHGHWIEKEDMIGSYLEQSNVAFYECSVCKEPSGEISSYCPNCGAKMDGGDDNAAD